MQHDEKGRGQAKLLIPATGRYADAQLDDHRHLPRAQFPHRPPFRLMLRARTSTPEPFGTFGFGLWNDPFSLSLGQAGAARRLPASPQALWFFYASRPTDLALAPGVPGRGWKAASLCSRQVHPILLAILASVAYGAARVASLRGPVISQAQRFYRAAEAVIPCDLCQWHQYEIAWMPDVAQFRVDDRLVLTTPSPPDPPLGLILWIDNQFAVASPEKGLGFGVLGVDIDQWLEIGELEVEK